MQKSCFDKIILTARIRALLILLASSFSIHAEADQDTRILVDIDWLVEHHGDDDLLIIDARSELSYATGHIPGAINLPAYLTIKHDPPKDLIGGLRQIKKIFGQAGIQHNQQIVIYDDGVHKDAGHAFWVFEVYNHSNVRLFNGGFPAWQEHSELPIEKAVTSPTASDYIPEIEPGRHVNQFDMKLAIEDDTKMIIDVRSEDEFKGVKSTAKRYGHIPNAVNYPATDNFIEIDGIKRLKPLSELRAMYADVDRNKKIYTYCNRGKDSSLTYTLLRQLGHDVAQYDGSWLEWGNDPTVPVASSGLPSGTN